MEHRHAARAISPYEFDEPPTSVGRVFLARAFQHYCALHHGYSGEEIAAAFRDEASPNVATSVRMAARLIGEALARGAVRAWARPIGGGESTELKPGVWELDRFDHRFATSAIDPKRPFDAEAEPTSWIFIEMDAWNGLVEATLDWRPPSAIRKSVRLGPGAPVEEPVAPAGPAAIQRAGADRERHVRLPEVKDRTGLSRSTIYRRMGEGRFPQIIPQEGNVAAWRESELKAWLENPD